MRRIALLIFVLCLLGLVGVWENLEQHSPYARDPIRVPRIAATDATVKQKRNVAKPTVEQSVEASVAESPEISDCSFTPFQFPLSPLEQELWRIYNVSLRVLKSINATAWPTDGSLLGMMRHGRISTDRDVDMQLHSTYASCWNTLQGLKQHFIRAVGGALKSFKAVTIKGPKGKKIGRYAMIRMFRKYGTFDTGIDFNCVYMDEPEKPMFYTHRGVLTPMPLSVYPLSKCNLYGMDVACPRNGYAVLEALKPRYNGCMVFPHCMGDPLLSAKKCLSPHPIVPLSHFVDSIKELHQCGYVSLYQHLQDEHSCDTILSKGTPKNCEINGKKYCFLQGFDG